MRRTGVLRAVLAGLLIAGTALVVPAAQRHDQAAAAGMTLPTGFQAQTVFSGINRPTEFAFADDGRVFVAEKGGKIKVFDGLDDPTPTVFADLTTKVYDYQDRGLLGLALAPNFPADPWVYVLYSMDAPIGGTPPVWNDTCPTPPGQSIDGCVTGSRLSRLQANGDVMTGSEQVLVEDWCEQFPSHSIGTITFGSDGALYAGGGDGASYNYADYGQSGGSAGSPIPKNPCGDPPGGVGGTMTPPTAEGGALRAQDLVAASDPASLDGSIIRIDPDTGAPLPDNPNAAAADVNSRRIVAEGMRNPFRFAFRPGTTDLYIGDVGWNTWEEIDHHPDARSSVKNFGWPCYEGNAVQSGYQALGLNICQALYNAPSAVTPPLYTYQHGQVMAPGDACPTGGGSVSGIAFYNGGSLTGPVGTYPSQYDGAMFFADYSRKCISVMFPGSNGVPDPSTTTRFASNVGLAGAVSLHNGPGGDIYFADIGGGTIGRIRYFPNNRPPVAKIFSDATSGALPLTVHFDGTGSSDADGEPLTYSWDLDGDSVFGDSTSATPQFTYNDTANHIVSLRVTDTFGASDTAQVVINSGNRAPLVSLDTPTALTTWNAGDTIAFSATGTDPDDGTLPPSAFDWTVTLEHCPDGSQCHEHQIETFPGTKSGSFVAPDHEYPAHLKLTVTVTDLGGVSVSESVEIFPNTTTLTVQSDVPGATVGIDDVAGPSPQSQTVIVNSEHVVTAPLQKVGGVTYDFDKWSDGGAQTHTVIASSAKTLTASMSPRSVRAVDAVVTEPPNGSTRTVVVPVRLNAAPTRPVSVEWATEAGTAGAGTDFVAGSGAVVFPAGTRDRSITITVNGDATAEGNETFGVRLSSPQNADLVRDLATVRIQDNPTPVANAGNDFGVTSQSTGGALDASGSTDSGGLPLTYTWAQIDGPVATIQDQHAAHTQFGAPKGPATLTFRVTVTNTNGASSSDDVNVTVAAPK